VTDSQREAAAPVETLLHDLPARGTVNVCGGELVVVEGPNRGQRLSLGPLPVRVGSGLGCQLRLTDPTVSRLHFQLTPRRDAFRLVDAGSTNGTYVDGLRIHDVELAGGATIRVGATVLRVEVAAEPVRVQLSEQTRFGSLLGGSVEMRRLYALLARAASTDTTILIQGETGTGKDLVAREVHRHSRRAKGPFVAVDCGAIAPTVIESELFGHVRGSFTGALGDRRGLIEEASGGTLFLDEIGELPISLQAKLLRALEAREVRPVGANATRSVDVRIVAATNRSLAQSVNAGSFREDLYYRLAVVEVSLPPLRARRDDILLLAAQFLREIRARTAEPATASSAPAPSLALPAELASTLLARNWPGNVRELKNFVERCHALGVLDATWTDQSASGALPSGEAERVNTFVTVNLARPLKEARDEAMAQFERRYVESVLAAAEGNVTRAAALAGVSRRFLQRLIVRLGLRGPGLEDGDFDATEEDAVADGEDFAQ
jgi:transcriptional regulator with PAS, ATPase and Fis domain